MNNHARLGVGSPVTDPFPIAAEDLIEGDPKGRVALLRDEPSVMSGFFEAEPSRFHYTWTGDEMITVLDGRVTIELDDEHLDLGPGDSAFIRKGQKGIWHLHAPFREFFVYIS